MWQHSFFDDTERVINVASVPQRSPFRYPGGKTWLVPRIRQWLGQLPYHPAEFIEPFAGGGIVSLTVAAEGLAQHVRMVELDPLVAAVWETILHDDGGGEWLAQAIVSFDLTPETVKAELAKTDLSVRELAFQTILKNRVQRGGIMAPGAGLVKTGEAGKGLRSRWYPETLRKRILDIVQIRDKITFMHSDGLTLMRQHAEREDIVFFIDPPYTASTKQAGSRLYTHPHIDHKQLFNIADAVSGDFLMTYDDAEEVRTLACAHNFDMQTVAMKNTHHSTMKELLIGRDLSWIR
ncbi:MAG TPA: DNA adenine methylase [Roseiflexaceae bacterium]|nr:DNA adenine methylase [Roseiflexaceae bacterium]